MSYQSLSDWVGWVSDSVTQRFVRFIRCVKRSEPHHHATACASFLSTSYIGLFAATPLQALELDSSVETSYWSSSRQLDQQHDLTQASLWLKARHNLGDNSSLRFDGWLQNNHSGRNTHIREAFIDTSFGRLDLRIGKQIIVWGKADRFNPTDNLNARDYTLLFSSDDETRLGRNSLKATYHFDQLSASLIWQPQFNGNQLPLPSLPGIHILPPNNQHQQTAFKLEQNGGAVDWSISWFQGGDTTPDLAPVSISPSLITLQLNHHRIQTLGADFATNLGDYGLRGEYAYTRSRDRDGTDPFIKNSFHYLVIGADRSFGDTLNINLQLAARHISDFQDAQSINNPIAFQNAKLTNQLDQNQYGLIFRINQRWLNDTLEAELSGLYNLPRHDYTLQPKLSYAISDHWKTILGSNHYHGRDDSYLSMLKPNNGGFVLLRYGQSW